VNSAKRGSARYRGFTLIEILVVMSILAVLLGLTAGMMQRASKAGVLDGVGRVVGKALERARMLAMSRNTLSRITVVPPAQGQAGQVTMQVGRIAGSWQFDEADPAVGGDGSTLRLLGAAPGPGFVRTGMVVTSVSRISGPPLNRAASHDPRFGFSLEMQIKPDSQGTIARFGPDTGDSGSWALRLNDDGSLAADATVRAENATLQVQTRPKVIEMGQWAKVAIAHDGVELTIAAHNVIEARVADLHEIEADPAAALVLGGFSGTIDEVVYRTVSDLDPFEIDRQVTVSLNYPLSVRFNQDGRLNERFHTGPVEIPLSHEGRTVTVTVDLAGVIR
jgi:prepilin-type N-terminal cleavage/methylation domain-containing protein